MVLAVAAVLSNMLIFIVRTMVEALVQVGQEQTLEGLVQVGE
jgi:hypothetical protein